MRMWLLQTRSDPHQLTVHHPKALHTWNAISCVYLIAPILLQVQSPFPSTTFHLPLALSPCCSVGFSNESSFLRRPGNTLWWARIEAAELPPSPSPTALFLHFGPLPRTAPEYRVWSFGVFRGVLRRMLWVHSIRTDATSLCVLTGCLPVVSRRIHPCAPHDLWHVCGCNT